jgi:hypothetical protein
MVKRDDSLDALAAEVKTIVGCNNTLNAAHTLGFWGREPQRSSEPKTTRTPDDYDGSDRLSISCTQTGLPARKQRELVEQWCALLPTLHNVRWLWFHSRVPQALFDAACQIPALQGLYVKWSGIESIEPLTHCRALKYFKLGSSGSLASIQPLERMTQLKWLQLDNITSTKHLQPLQSLTGLEGLGFTGAELKNFTIDSFAPLSGLQNLTWLHLGSVQTRDESLQPLTKLKKLEWLGVGNFFPVEEFARLSLHFPAGVCEWQEPYARFHSSLFPCRKCKANWKVMTSGKGSALLCPSCDSLKLARHIHKFKSAQETIRAAESDAR